MQAKDVLATIDAMAREGADFESVLEAAVHGVHALDPRFHWVGIYELFPDNVLRLGPFVGAPTEHVFIGCGEGICGTAVAERRTMNIPDVSRVTNYLACSSDTRSELVVLIRSGETIHAQVDIDSHELDAFDDAAVDAVEAVAARLAVLYDQRASKAA
jgi:L-methionine (R)-S-oxide reductase